MKVNLRRGYVGEVVEDGVTPYESIARLKEISIDYSESNDGEEYLFDAEKLHIILSTLLSYAIRFTPIGGAVAFTSDYFKRDDNYTDFTFTVSDSSTGIQSDKLPLIFDRLHQADDSTPGSFDENDISLALAKELAQLIGGNLTVKSELGEGTTFTLELLLRKAGNENVPFYESNRNRY